ncbi:6-phosphofructo-2-kinase/fructose-2,6-bisphosphatase 2 [Smittium culicis]|uniref:fructose-2,6-bisphosphate 2-phosphatase n=1 Tax=Smittium culicis TaxID=133412 RepID=A0A1R1YCG4_9FUNG|nr:6-phosphofructo-2-kinase/fructose-2,6-bisphosphatase 2 [Smittium culicis]
MHLHFVRNVLGNPLLCLSLSTHPPPSYHFMGRYLEWLGVSCKVFNVGEYRRKNVGSYSGHEFFDTTNPTFEKIRADCASEALDDLISWFDSNNSGVAIYDATNSTLKRRKLVYSRCKENSIDVMFAESWCDDEELIMKNILEVKKSSPDYAGVTDFTKVIDDFKLRISHYNGVYQQVGTKPDPNNPIPELQDYDESQLTYVRKINVGAQMVINRIKDYMQSRIVFFLMNIHITPRSILFSRHGESEYNQLGLLGGDSGLSPNGLKYASALPALVSKIMGDKKLCVWTSTLKRTIQTASHLSHNKIQFKALDEIDAGLCDGLSYADVKERYPEEYATRKENKFEFRYHGGESYRDVVLRLEPIIMELERQQNIMIVSHQAVLRCIYAYFLEVSPSELPYIKIPLHTVMKLTWTAYGCEAQMYSLDIKAVDTHITKPKSAGKSEKLDIKIPASNPSPSSTANSTPITATPSSALKSSSDIAPSSEPVLNKDLAIPDSNGGSNLNRKFSLINKNQRVEKHFEIIGFPNTIANNSKLFYNNAVPQINTDDSIFAMEAQPVASPQNTSFLNEQMPHILKNNGSVSTKPPLAKNQPSGLPIKPSHSGSSNSSLPFKYQISDSNSINLETENDSSIKDGVSAVLDKPDNANLHNNLTITPCNIEDLVSQPRYNGLAPGSVYPLGSIISNQVTPCESRSDSPSILSRSGSLSPVNKDKQSLLSSILSSENNFFDGNISSISSNNSNFENSHSENNSYKTLADIKPNDAKGSSEISPFDGSQDKYLANNTVNGGVPINLSSKNESADSDLSKSDNSSACSFEKKISKTNSALGLSIEKIEKLELNGYGKVKVIQTKPALALSFTQPSNMDKLGKISAIKQGLTGLDTL